MTKERISQKGIALLMTVAVTLLFSACAQTEREKNIDYISEKYAIPEENQLIVYTSHKEEVYLPIIREFESRTGIWVDVHAGGTTEMMRAARAASKNGECDIFVDADFVFVVVFFTVFAAFGLATDFLVDIFFFVVDLLLAEVFLETDFFAVFLAEDLLEAVDFAVLFFAADVVFLVILTFHV